MVVLYNFETRNSIKVLRRFSKEHHEVFFEHHSPSNRKTLSLEIMI